MLKRWSHIFLIFWMATSDQKKQYHTTFLSKRHSVRMRLGTHILKVVKVKVKWAYSIIYEI